MDRCEAGVGGQEAAWSKAPVSRQKGRPHEDNVWRRRDQLHCDGDLRGCSEL